MTVHKVCMNNYVVNLQTGANIGVVAGVILLCVYVGDSWLEVRTPLEQIFHHDSAAHTQSIEQARR